MRRGTKNGFVPILLACAALLCGCAHQGASSSGGGAGYATGPLDDCAYEGGYGYGPFSYRANSGRSPYGYGYGAGLPCGKLRIWPFDRATRVP